MTALEQCARALEEVSIKQWLAAADRVEASTLRPGAPELARRDRDRIVSDLRRKAADLSAELEARDLRDAA